MLNKPACSSGGKFVETPDVSSSPLAPSRKTTTNHATNAMKRHKVISNKRQLGFCRSGHLNTFLSHFVEESIINHPQKEKLLLPEQQCNMAQRHV